MARAHEWSSLSRQARRALRMLVLLAALGALASPASPCLEGSTGDSGPFWTGRGWAFAVPHQIEGRTWLVEYDPRGALLDDRPLPVEVADGWPTVTTVMAVESDGALWMHVTCRDPGARDEPLCNRMARIDAGGAVQAQWRKPIEEWLQTDGEPWSFVLGQVNETRLRLQALDTTTSETLLPPRELTLPSGIGPTPPGRWSGAPRAFRNAPIWTIGPDGAIALVQSDGATVRVVVLEADGEIRYDRSFPQATPDRLLERSDTTFRLGAPGLVALAADGSLVLTAWRLHPDCSRDREPGLVILDPAGRLRAEVATEHHPTGLAVAPGGEVAVLAFTEGLVFDLDGRELARFQTRPAAWADEERRLAERALTMGPDDDPAEWIAVYAAAPDHIRPQLDAWLVAAWPRSEAHLPDAQWQRLGARLCSTHPDAAPAAALRRFEASRGRAKASWLDTLVDCFREAPPGALDYAGELAERDGGHHGSTSRRAFDAWGTPFARLQADVEKMLATPWTVVAREVPLSLERTLPLLEDALRSELPERRNAARSALVGWLARPADSWGDEERPRVEAARRLLVTRAARWASDPEPFVASTGRLALLATGTRPASELLPGLVAEAKRDVELGHALPAAVAYGTTDSDLTSLDDALLTAMLSLADDGAENTAPRGSGMAGSEEHRLVERLGDRGRDLVWQRAMASGAAHEVRRRLLEHMAGDPVVWGEARLREVLEAEWMSQQAPYDLSRIYFLNSLVRFLRAVLMTAEDHAVAATTSNAASDTERVTSPKPTPTSLDRLAAQRFRDIFLGTAASLPASRRAQLLVSLFLQTGFPSPSLLSALEPADAASLVDGSPSPLSEWLWLVAETGAWPAIEDRLVEMLPDSRLGFGAALALAPLGRHEALDVLVERGLTNTIAPRADAFVAFGSEARDRLLPYLEHQDTGVRLAVRRVLRALAPPAALVERFAADSEATFDRGELPDVETVLLLDDAGRDVFPALLAAASAAPKPYGPQNQVSTLGYLRNSEFPRRLGRWAVRSGTPDQRAQALVFLRAIAPIGNPVQVVWSRRVEASLDSAPTR